MKKRKDSGFALLLVFLMAAVIAISLYLEIPRVAFQSQRQKEQLLIERGEQYKRAIQLFVKVNGRYPAEIKDLENFNNRRFLRHKFIDPMTGKDDWRLVHINNGVMTDSVLNKPKGKPGDANQQASTAGQYVGEQAGLGVSLTPAQQTANLALTRRRASDGGAAPPATGPDGQPLPPNAAPPEGAVSQQGQPEPGAPPLPEGQLFNAGQGPAGTQPTAGTPVPYPGFPATVANPQATPATPLPPEVANQPGAPTVPGQPPIRPTLPGQVPFGGQMPGGQSPGAQSNSGSSYVGGSQPYVGSSQPYVGGGTYVGSQSTTPNTGATGAPGQPNFQQNPGFQQNVGFQQNSGFQQNPGFQQNAGFQPNPGFQANPGAQQNQGFQGPVGGTPTSAANMINNLLTTPRPPQMGTPGGGPGGLAPGQQGALGVFGMGQAAQTGVAGTGGPGGLAPGQQGVLGALGIGQPVGQAGGPGGQQIGGGIAGVASKMEQPAIMVYNDHTHYNEWEFVFDYTKQTTTPNPAGGTIGTPAANLGTPAGSPGFGAAASPSGGQPGAAPAANSPFGAGAAMPGGAPGAAGANPGRGGATPGANQPASGLPPGIRLGRP